MLGKAIYWIHQHQLNQQAIPVSDRQRKPYPEVTGYYIPTLLSLGEMALATNFSNWLVSVQNPDGSFSLDNPTISYVFDTGQVIRGWVSMIERMPELTVPLRKACEWMMAQMDPVSGRLQCPAPGGDWHLGERGEVSEGIHLYVLKPLRDAADQLKWPALRQAVDRSLTYYLANVSITEFNKPNALTHFYAYIQEALVELGCVEEARQGMASVAKYQQANGAVPAYHDVKWVCSTGLAQLAKVWYLLNDIPRADAALRFLASLQNHSGGFYGSYGVNATYFPSEEISWAVKYAIDAEQMSIARHFDHTAHHYAETMSPDDGRVKEILQELPQAQRILDAGCGNGRYAALFKSLLPHLDVHAVDISESMLMRVPKTITVKKASIQNLPYPDAYFDVVYCVEALEHALHPVSAIQEMYRVLRPNGRLIIIDKNHQRKGVLQTERWERWFDKDALKDLMTRCQMKTRATFVSYDNKPADGLFIAWVGEKMVATPEKVSI